MRDLVDKLRNRTTLIIIFGIVILGLVGVGTFFLLKMMNNNGQLIEEGPTPIYHIVKEDVNVKSYFAYMDNLVLQYDTLGYTLNEHIIVHTNSWLIDSLEHTDYYLLQAKGIFNYDQPSLVVLHQGDTLIIPDSLQVQAIVGKLTQTVIDVNIPEFKIRVLENEKELYTFPVRVGQNRSKYLAMAGRNVDLRTHTGTGTIVRINKNAAFINPKDNHRYYTTRRDDGKRTLVPIIPWLEPELNGTRYGQLIHPTTNPVTLGKAYSNGCIGMKEADVWRLYYHAPLGTKVIFRYDLKIKDENGKNIELKDIYPNKHRRDNFSKTAMNFLSPIEIGDFQEVTFDLADQVE